ncbi:MAG: hypothetical protein ACQER4_04135 [Bacteroidota bacterium]
MARFLEYPTRLIAHLSGWGLLTVLVIVLSGSNDAFGQSSGMDWKVRPDLWWNTVDGVRPGLQFKGWESGPSRHIRRELDSGVWIATRWPDHPVSYRFRWSEPLPFWTGRDSGAALGIISSHRVGIRTHGMFLTGRWNRRSSHSPLLELELRYEQMRRTDPGYRIYPQRWQSDWNERFILEMNWQTEPDESVLQSVYASVYHQVRGESFQGGDIRWMVRTASRAPWGVESLLRFGTVGSSARPEFRYGIQSGQAIRLLEDPMWRARGTLPPSGVTSGFLQPYGGMLRGYGKQEARQWSSGETPLWEHKAGGEWRVWTPNPVQQALQQVETVREFVSFRTHLFFASGYLGGGMSDLADGWYHEGGAGVEWRLEVPDNHTGFRGFSIRYDIPVWLSRPGEEEPIHFRHVLGVHGRFDL